MNIESYDKSETRKFFEIYRDQRNALLESEGHKPGSKWHVTNAHYSTWEASRAAIEVELPPYANTGVDTGGWPIDSGSHRVNGIIDKFRVAIESLGLKVKS